MLWPSRIMNASRQHRDLNESAQTTTFNIIWKYISTCDIWAHRNDYFDYYCVGLANCLNFLFFFPSQLIFSPPHSLISFFVAWVKYSGWIFKLLALVLENLLSAENAFRCSIYILPPRKMLHSRLTTISKPMQIRKCCLAIYAWILVRFAVIVLFLYLIRFIFRSLFSLELLAVDFHFRLAEISVLMFIEPFFLVIANLQFIREYNH